MPNQIITPNASAIEAALNKAKAERSVAMAKVLKTGFRSLFCRSDCRVQATLGNGQASLAG